jgi:hypothetical protein
MEENKMTTQKKKEKWWKSVDKNVLKRVHLETRSLLASSEHLSENVSELERKIQNATIC